MKCISDNDKQAAVEALNKGAILGVPTETVYGLAVKADNTEAIRAYLMRAILFTYFQSGTTSKLQQMKSNINSYDYEITVEMLDQITDLRVTDGKIEDILNAEKGSRVAGDALYYLCLDWINKNFKYEQDHLLAISTINPGQHYTYQFAAAWSKFDVHSFEEWKSILEKAD